MISHPQFAKAHLQLPQTQAKTRLCIINFEEEKDDASLVVRVSTKDWESIGDGNGNGGLLDFDYSLSDVNLKHSVHLLNSCDGLLCLVDSLGKIVLWNPSTRQYNPLPPNANGPKCSWYGFGYCWDVICFIWGLFFGSVSVRGITKWPRFELGTLTQTVALLVPYGLLAQMVPGGQRPKH